MRGEYLKLLKESLTKNISVEELAKISDEALDNAYHYGRSKPGNTFGWLANMESAKAAKEIIEKIKKKEKRKEMKWSHDKKKR